MNSPISNNHIHLSKLILEETIHAKVQVKTWEEAVQAVGELLLSAGKIKPEYITSMKRVLKEMGPYAVIAPGIVLLHARPEDGVIEPCLGLITLVDPVPFGHPEMTLSTWFSRLGRLINRPILQPFSSWQNCWAIQLNYRKFVLLPIMVRCIRS